MAANTGFGILGAGLISPLHARAIHDAEGADLIAVCDMDLERARKLAEPYGARVYDSLEAMLADPAIGVVCVVTPNHLHCEAVVACARAGKHVLCEKPPAMSLAETDRMIQTCRENRVKLGCFVQCRVRGAIQAMKQAIGEGRFGRLLSADAYMKWYRSVDYYKSDAWRQSRKSGAGVTVQQAFHYIDLLTYLAGPVTRVEAWMRNIAHPEIAVEDTTIAHLEFASGAMGLVQASSALWPGTDVRVELNGENGTTIMSGERMVTWRFREEKPEDGAMRQLGSESQATAAGGAADLGHLDHQVVIQDMVDALREEREVIIPLTTVRHTLEIVLGMYQSAARRRPVELPVADDDSIWAWPESVSA